jgi:hypothetical protein
MRRAALLRVLNMREDIGVGVLVMEQHPLSGGRILCERVSDKCRLNQQGLQLPRNLGEAVYSVLPENGTEVAAKLVKRVRHRVSFKEPE